MSNYINIVSFILTTYLYYLLFKPTLTYDQLTDEKEITIYYSNSYTFLAIYFFAVILIQLLVNVNVINDKCGGKISDNIGYAGILTIVPWTLIFGILIVVLTIYPGFKSAFADVIGYYWVSSSANKLITEILIDRDVENNLSESMTQATKNELDRAADAIIKICGNSSVLINQMTPHNYQNFWEILNPLKKDKYRPNSKNYNEAETIDKRNKLFNLVVTKDNIGESMWYLYTGLLVTSVVQLKIASKGCKNNPKTMEANYQKFKDNQIKKNSEKSSTLESEPDLTQRYSNAKSYTSSGMESASNRANYVASQNEEYNS